MSSVNERERRFVCPRCHRSYMTWTVRCLAPSCQAYMTRGPKARPSSVAEPAPPVAPKAPEQLAERIVARAESSTESKQDEGGDPTIPRSVPIPIMDIDVSARETRIATGIEPLDRVLGGGIVVGSLVFLGGEPGIGKCLGQGTPVLLHDGRVLPVESILPGDQLMGPDGEPRIVLSANEGEDELFKITPTKGEPWVCNASHMMTLVESGTDEIFDMPLDRLQRSPQSFRHHAKLFTVGIDRFGGLDRILSIDPYFLGLWFGDGTKEMRGSALGKIAITKPDREVEEACRKVATAWGLRLEIYKTEGGGNAGSECPTYHLVGERGYANPLLVQMRDLVGPRIEMPERYLRAPRLQRLEFLAGLLDSDGDLGNGCFSITQKREDWARDAWWMARSLGLCSTIAKKIGRCKRSDGSVFEGEYWRVIISGDVDIIPTRIPRKRAEPRQQKKVATRTGFDIEAIGRGAFYGFTLDGDGRFLLGDFTVTHNSTLLMQMTASASCDGCRLYATGEESTAQVAMRAHRIGATLPDIQIVQETDVEAILWHAVDRKARIVVIDSIHAISSSKVSGLAGSDYQVKTCAQLLMAFAKSTGVATIAISHVNKDGDISGPRNLEHAGDVTLMFERSELGDPWRTLRAQKNRFGSELEFGMFQMLDSGLVPIHKGCEPELDPAAHGDHDQMLPIAQELLHRVLELGGVIDDGLRDRIAGRLDLVPRGAP